ncbi:MAG: hypothetical protein EP329_25190 [Deltaproteobacteria bacterium]|nr:MAG: hypothetical protein EP329_25190 [Deltaproteobacteria bacterium]
MPTPRPRTTAIALSSLTLLLAGCIESHRTLATPDADTTSADTLEVDGVGPDTVTPVEDTSAPPPDSSPGDTVVPDDTTAPDIMEIPCVADSECDALPLGPCEVARCVLVTCQVEPVEPGTTCDNGTGQTPGTCVDGHLQGPDTCSVDGVCFDAPPPLAAPLTNELLGGNWFFVLSTVDVPDSSSVTFRGDFTIDGGDLTLTTTGVSQQTAALQGMVAGKVCMTDGRDVRIELGADRVLRGAFTSDGEILAATGFADRSVLVATRGTGAPSSISGTYDFVTTSLVPGNILRTWVGSIPFQAGCQSGEGTMVTTAGGSASTHWRFPTSPLGDNGCFTTPSDAVAPLLITLSLSNLVGSESSLIRWRGGASDGGALIVMTRDDYDPDPRYGTIILVRRPDDDVGLGGYTWAEMFQGKRAAADRPIGEYGVFEVDGTTLTGRSRATGETDSVATTGTLANQQVGLYGLTVTRNDGETPSTTPYLMRRASRNDVAFYYVSGTDFSDEAPAAASLGVAVRRGDNDIPTLLR